jgi:hypothetical protein
MGKLLKISLYMYDETHFKKKLLFLCDKFFLWDFLKKVLMRNIFFKLYCVADGYNILSKILM